MLPSIGHRSWAMLVPVLWCGLRTGVRARQHGRMDRTQRKQRLGLPLSRALPIVCANFPQEKGLAGAWRCMCYLSGMVFRDVDVARWAV